MEHFWPAVIACGRFVSAMRIGVHRKVHIVRDEEVEIAISIEIAKRHTCGPLVVRHARFFRDVCESAVAVIAVENGRPEAGDINIGEPSLL